jgi:dTDP-4-amino-4,6-dideoxy-D-galactose acyltransferase
VKEYGKSAMTADYSEILLHNKKRLYYYSTYKFIREHDQDAIFTNTVLSPLLEKMNGDLVAVKQIVIDDEPHYILIEPLPWDSRYFGIPVYKVLTVLYAHKRYGLLKRAMLQWSSEISSRMNSRYTMEIPSEDTDLIQAACECGFRLTETRLHYVLSDISSHCRERYPVRKATEDDIENLRNVAIQMRNPYDRLHADISIQREVADDYVATYIENSVRGFADHVLVPAEGTGPPDAFHTCSVFPERILGKRLAKFGIVAVSKETRKGWHVKLLSETIHLLKDKEVDYILVNTQASNRAANRVLASFGFALAFVTHIFSKSFEPHLNPQ